MGRYKEIGHEIRILCGYTLVWAAMIMLLVQMGQAQSINFAPVIGLALMGLIFCLRKEIKAWLKVPIIIAICVMAVAFGYQYVKDSQHANLIVGTAVFLTLIPVIRQFLIFRATLFSKKKVR